MLSNPIVVRMAVVLFVSAFGLWVATLLLRRMRRILTEESFAVDSVPELDQFPMHTYNAVIQQLGYGVIITYDDSVKAEFSTQDIAEQGRIRRHWNTI